MHKPRVYVETSIFSYLAARPSRDAIAQARQNLTVNWWEHRRQSYELIVSPAVEGECARGDRDAASRRLKFLVEASIFLLNDQTTELASALIGPGRIPRKAETDAIHIAAAVLANCDYLLTWNFRHLANAQIRREIERILRSHGHPEILICTPEELAQTPRVV